MSEPEGERRRHGLVAGAAPGDAGSGAVRLADEPLAGGGTEDGDLCAAQAGVVGGHRLGARAAEGSGAEGLPGLTPDKPFTRRGTEHGDLGGAAITEVVGGHGPVTGGAEGHDGGGAAEAAQ